MAKKSASVLGGRAEMALLVTLLDDLESLHRRMTLSLPTAASDAAGGREAGHGEQEVGMHCEIIRDTQSGDVSVARFATIPEEGEEASDQAEREVRGQRHGLGGAYENSGYENTQWKFDGSGDVDKSSCDYHISNDQFTPASADSLESSSEEYLELPVNTASHSSSQAVTVSSTNEYHVQHVGASTVIEARTDNTAHSQRDTKTGSRAGDRGEGDELEVGRLLGEVTQSLQVLYGSMQGTVACLEHLRQRQFSSSAGKETQKHDSKLSRSSLSSSLSQGQPGSSSLLGVPVVFHSVEHLKRKLQRMVASHRSENAHDQHSPPHSGE